MTREQAAEEFANTHQRNYMLTEKEDYKVSLKMAYLRGRTDAEHEREQAAEKKARELLGDNSATEFFKGFLLGFTHGLGHADQERQQEYQYLLKFIEHENNKRSHE